MAMATQLVFDRQFDPETGRPISVADGLVRVTAPNSSAYTFTGTNSFVVGHERVAIIDPGPDEATHLAALQRAIDGRAVEAIILTHTHRDHSALARQLAERVGAPLWFGGRHRLSRPLRRFERNALKKSCDWALVPDLTLVDGQTIRAGNLSLTVHATPGHCANHLAFGLGDLLLCGDHVMGWNSTLVATPDGSMADYLASLEKLIALPYQRYVPAHGGPIADGRTYAMALLAHRQLRNAQVVEAVGAGARTISAIVEAIYPTQAVAVRRAARMTIVAHVEYLTTQKLLTVSHLWFGDRIMPSLAAA
jgi:glyoxylase-like metal-dependent hydrolase (beta-lactamase superfamily II)